MSVAPSTTWPLVAMSPSERMKNPVPIPRTGVSPGVPPWPYMRSRKSRNGSFSEPRAVVATMPTTAGIELRTSPAIEAGGATGRSLAEGASVQSFAGVAAARRRRANGSVIEHPGQERAVARLSAGNVGIPAPSGNAGVLATALQLGDQLLRGRV